MNIKFLGGAGTVTGSKYLITHENQRVLVDCGLYQGVKKLRLRNRGGFPIDPKTINAVILTHAHIDHSGYVPALRKNGFKGPVYCTKGTYDLCKILLPDSGYLQEEDARYANKKKFSRHSPALPLYTEKDAIESLKLFKPVQYHKPLDVANQITATFTPVGHILGSAAVQISAGGKTITFSGDVGRTEDLVMRPPEPLSETDYLVVESTYGNRRHDETDPFEFFKNIINKTMERGGIVLLPSFAVGRAQTILYIIQLLKERNEIPDVPVYLNSPMAITATEIYCNHHKEHRLTAEECEKIDKDTHFVRTPEESIELNNRKYPSIIISASGMASGGWVLHHLKALLPNHRNSVVFVGFQAPGTRGDAMVNGAEQVKIHGAYHPVRAEVSQIDSLSAHGDYVEILDWLDQSNINPKQVFVTHGEPVASDSMRLKLEEKFGWKVEVPDYGEEFNL
ncbi:MBL fold metallo-hydrolase RNA specificity domain-containing protein [Alkalimarinus alittae]|uniref:MBL fold metallo-hydrolase n=1 Tax=Alkalimarinus alittae TaxID=2961619 RepID=A0ABY6MZ82_9ALTE|nr:MBL fold metallo-hydrolase [Alkalimarinus alittae]UZE95146.1 MBL fold metallo-hydrolase [Alkalimarinus alittae]